MIPKEYKLTFSLCYFYLVNRGEKTKLWHRYKCKKKKKIIQKIVLYVGKI